jgi:hypothetical protein
MNLIDHLESEFGKIQHGWDAFPESDEKWPVQVAEMRKGRYPDMSVFCTTGLSNFELISKVSGKIIRQELFVIVPASYGSNNIPALLHDIFSRMIEKGYAYLRGDVIDHGSGNLLPKTNFTAFYVAPPVYFSEEFASFQIAPGKTAAICWLIPVYETEKVFIKVNGWDLFEMEIQRKDPDFFNLNRGAIV